MVNPFLLPASPLRLLAYDVALKIERDIGGRAAFARFAAPHAISVLHQPGYAAEASRLDAGFCLRLGKTVRARRRRVGVDGGWSGYCGGMGIGISRRWA